MVEVSQDNKKSAFLVNFAEGTSGQMFRHTCWPRSFDAAGRPGFPLAQINAQTSSRTNDSAIQETLTRYFPKNSLFTHTFFMLRLIVPNTVGHVERRQPRDPRHIVYQIFSYLLVKTAHISF